MQASELSVVGVVPLCPVGVAAGSGAGNVVAAAGLVDAAAGSGAGIVGAAAGIVVGVAGTAGIASVVVVAGSVVAAVAGLPPAVSVGRSVPFVPPSPLCAAGTPR